MSQELNAVFIQPSLSGGGKWDIEARGCLSFIHPFLSLKGLMGCKDLWMFWSSGVRGIGWSLHAVTGCAARLEAIKVSLYFLSKLLCGKK